MRSCELSGVSCERQKASAVAEALCGFGFRLLSGGLGLAGVRLGELAAEALDATCGVDQLLLAGEEGVAGGADFEDDVALVRGAGLKVVSAGALDGDVVVVRVNPFFGHGKYPLSRATWVSCELFACRLADRLQRSRFTSHRGACRAAAHAPVREQSSSFISLAALPLIRTGVFGFGRVSCLEGVPPPPLGTPG